MLVAGATSSGSGPTTPSAGEVRSFSTNASSIPSGRSRLTARRLESADERERLREGAPQPGDERDAHEDKEAASDAHHGEAVAAQERGEPHGGLETERDGEERQAEPEAVATARTAPRLRSPGRLLLIDGLWAPCRASSRGRRRSRGAARPTAPRGEEPAVGLQRCEEPDERETMRITTTPRTQKASVPRRSPPTEPKRMPYATNTTVEAGDEQPRRRRGRGHGRRGLVGAASARHVGPVVPFGVLPRCATTALRDGAARRRRQPCRPGTEVAGDEWQDARRREGQQPGEDGDGEREEEGAAEDRRPAREGTITFARTSSTIAAIVVRRAARGRAAMAPSPVSTPPSGSQRRPRPRGPTSPDRSSTDGNGIS